MHLAKIPLVFTNCPRQCDGLGLVLIVNYLSEDSGKNPVFIPSILPFFSHHQTSEVTAHAQIFLSPI